MTLCSLCLCGFIYGAFADITVVGTVDQNHVALGEPFTFTVAVSGAQNGVQPAIPQIDGLRWEGPSPSTSVNIVNGQMSQSVRLTYRVTASRLGEFNIPAIAVDVGGTKYTTQPIKVVVEKNALEDKLKEMLFGKLRFNFKQVYLGQTAPLDVLLFVRQDTPLRGLNPFNEQADGLGYKYLTKDIKQVAQVIDGVSYTVVIFDGSISPTRTGTLTFGPTVIPAQLRVEKKNRGSGSPFDDPFFQPFFQNVEVREVPVTIDAIPIEVLPLPEQGKPAEFAGAVGQWKLEVSAAPTQVSVGDPITVTVKVSGDGNIDTVPAPQLAVKEEDFKTYAPTSKTSPNELHTQGERTFEQVLIPRHADVKQLPEVRLAYFDPVAKQYKIARQESIKLVVKAGASPAAVVGATSTSPSRPKERLGQDIVYLKGDVGTALVATPFCSTPAFWTLNASPVLALCGAVIWKRRSDKLRSDVAYARRSRAAKEARRLLATASTHDAIQHALQSYLGDRLNIPSSGITASVVDEQLAPRGIDGSLAMELKACFEECDSARFAGGGNATNANAMRGKVEKLIDELEKKQF